MGADMIKMEADVVNRRKFLRLSSSAPSRSQTHPNLPQGKEQVTLYLNFRQSLQPPLVLPRRGDAGYFSSVKDWVMQVTPVLSKTG